MRDLSISVLQSFSHSVKIVSVKFKKKDNSTTALLKSSEPPMYSLKDLKANIIIVLGSTLGATTKLLSDLSFHKFFPLAYPFFSFSYAISLSVTPSLHNLVVLSTAISSTFQTYFLESGFLLVWF